MGFDCGIIGLPNAGKSTIFNALTGSTAAVAGYPFTTIDPNTGTVTLPDERLQKIAALIDPKKLTPATMEFVDVAGLVRGAHKGEGLGNQFLGTIRNLPAMAHVVRCFEDENVAHPEGDVNPLRDIEIIETELILADIATIQRRIDKVKKTAQTGDADAKRALAVYEKTIDVLDAGKPASTLSIVAEERAVFDEMQLLSAKPVLFIANLDEDAVITGNEHSDRVRAAAESRGSGFVTISGKIEAELLDLEEDERAEYLGELGLSETGLAQVIRAGYRLLRLVTFYTTVGPELRAWSITEGTTAPAAAGKIHTDMERGFIRAEVLSAEDLFAAGGEHEAKESGKVRIEGKEYVIEDGDIVRIRFNV
ncbi:MAG: redox-regulated ATPase YchF [Deltaproteobacteria bacterium]|nr:redox-regulated ATPase YchF [Candidatus Zymogenaceae bacterium]